MPTRRDALGVVPPSLLAGLAGCTDLLTDGDDDREPEIPKAWTTRSRVARFWSRLDDGPPVINLGGTRQPGGQRLGLVAIDPETGDHIWEADGEHELAAVAGQELTVSLPVIRDGTVYALTSAGAVFALEAATGDLLWDSKGSIPIGWYAEEDLPRETPVPVGDVVCATLTSRTEGADAATVYAFDAENGDERWTVDLEASVPGVPAAGDSTLVVPRSDGTLEAIGTDGDRIWNESIDDRGTLLAVADGAVVAGGVDETLYALDLEDGTERWRTDAGTTATTAPTPAGDVLVVGDGAGSLRAFDPTDGSLAWRTDLEYAPTTVAVAGDRVVALTGVTQVEWPDESLGWPFSAVDSPEAVVLTVHDVADGAIVAEYDLEWTSRGGRPYGVASDGDGFYLSRHNFFSRLDPDAVDQ